MAAPYTAFRWDGSSIIGSNTTGRGRRRNALADIMSGMISHVAATPHASVDYDHDVRNRLSVFDSIILSALVNNNRLPESEDDCSSTGDESDKDSGTEDDNDNDGDILCNADDEDLYDSGDVAREDLMQHGDTITTSVDSQISGGMITPDNEDDIITECDDIDEEDADEIQFVVSVENDPEAYAQLHPKLHPDDQLLAPVIPLHIDEFGAPPTVTEYGIARLTDFDTRFWLDVMEMTSLQAIFSLSECTRHLRDVAQLAKKRFLLTRRVRSCAFRLFGYKDQFWKVVERSGAFASGSFLLYALSGSEYHWTPNDMDLFRAKIPSILNTSCYGPDDIGPFSELDTYLYRRSIRHVMQETYNELMKFKVLSYEMDHVTEWKRLSERAEAHRQHSESISQGTTADAGSHIHYFPEPSFEHKCQCEHILQKHGYRNNRNNQPCDDHLLMTIRRMCPVHRQAANAPIITYSRTSHKAQIMVIIKSYKKHDEKELTIGSHQTKNDTDTFVEVQKEDVKHNIERTFG